MKYTYMSRLSILAVGLIFLLQALLVYRLYETNVDLLQRELNLVMQSTYDADLNLRLDPSKKSKEPSVEYFGTTPPPGIDTTKTTRIDARGLDKKLNKGLVSAMNIAMEEFIGRKYPINLPRIDSVAGIFLKQNNINMKFYSEIIDLKTNEVLETSLQDSNKSSDLLYSKVIFLNVKQTKGLRLVLIDPMRKIYPQMAWMLILSLLLSIFCIYSLYVQKRTLAKQRQLSKLKNDFFSEVSHEFKRPLAVLLQSINSLSNEKIIINEEKRTRMLNIAEQEIVKMTSKTDMLLSLAQEEEGLFELHRTEFDFAKVVFDLVDNAIDTTPGSPEIDINNELKNPMIFADKDHIEQVVSNLISNAIKYSRESIDIQIRLYQENNNICISVKDSGLGISRENLDVIFEKYSRVGKTTHAKGHGIGLNYVKRIVEKHGGSISVDSQLNIGSQFIVKLPLVKNIN